jgi:dTDP-glucose 4,6-dehydratase
MNILITGGAGFIGSALIRYLINNTQYNIVNIDKLSYSGSLLSLKEVSKSSRYSFEKIDICNSLKLKNVFKKYRPQIIFHLAAESHVDNSIDKPYNFINTNIFGTYNLLEITRQYFIENKNNKKSFKFIHVSTDEVYGDLGIKDKAFNEQTPYMPSSPYSATKASSDHLVRAWGRTYKIPYSITNCSNNYGPFQFPEKLIPNVIIRATKGMPIKVYGSGKQIRDWLYVDDHVKALALIAEDNSPFQTYNIGGSNEIENIQVVLQICNYLDKFILSKPKKIKKFSNLIKYVKDRPGHDIRYAVDASKIKKKLSWKPNQTFKSGLKKTIMWYLNNKDWVSKVSSNKNL